VGQRSNWQLRLDEVIVKINGEHFYLWSVVDHERGSSWNLLASYSLNITSDRYGHPFRGVSVPVRLINACERVVLVLSVGFINISNFIFTFTDVIIFLQLVMRAIKTLANSVWFGVITASPQFEFIQPMSVIYDFSYSLVILWKFSPVPSSS